VRDWVICANSALSSSLSTVGFALNGIPH
jgi:hypothetical protein